MKENLVKVKRLFNAPVNQLWSIWTEPTFVNQWFGSDENGTVIPVNIDLSLEVNTKLLLWIQMAQNTKPLENLMITTKFKV